MTMVKFGIQILCVAWFLTVTVSWLECLLLSSNRFTFQHLIMSLASEDIMIYIVATKRTLCNKDVKFSYMNLEVFVLSQNSACIVILFLSCFML